MGAVAQNFMKAFGWTILDSFWQCGIVYCVLAIILIFFRNLSSTERHNLAYLSICIMFGWFIYTFLNKLNFYSPVTTSVIIADPSIQNSFSSQQPATFQFKAEVYFPLILIAYLTGILLQIVLLVKGFLIIQKLKRIHPENISPEYQNLFNKIAKNLKIRPEAILRVSSQVKTPMVIGYLKPLVLFPASLCTHLDTDQVEAILIHELVHIRRNDYLLNLVKTCIETLLFFNPFVWLAGRVIEIEREHACDDIVLKYTGKPVSYANALLQLEMHISTQTPAYVMAASGKRQYLFHRIKRITSIKTNYVNVKQQMAALTLAVACLISFAWIRPAENKNKQITTVAKSIKKPIIFSGNNNKKIEIAADTIILGHRHKIKTIVTNDADNKKKYNSVKGVPDSLKGDFKVVKNPEFQFKNGDTIYYKHVYKNDYKQSNSKEWNKWQVQFAKKFISPEWKNKQEDLAKHYQKLALNFQKTFNSSEWKKETEGISKALPGTGTQ